MSKLYQYDDIKKLNQALGSFARNKVKVEKVETIVVVDILQYFVLADPKEVFKKSTKVESKTEEEAKKTLKVKKEVKEKKKVKVKEKADK